MGALEGRDDRVLEVVTAGAEWEALAGGFLFTEGPVWMEEEGALYFSDIPADSIWRVEADTYRVSLFRRSSRKSNGLTRDPAGFILACEHGARRVSRIAPDGVLTEVVADRFEGRRFNSPNDIVADSSGRIWFTDPTYGIRGLDVGYPAAEEQPVAGVYRVDRDGRVSLVAGDLVTPNGLAFSPDEKRLYVADTERSLVRRFGVEDDGSLTDTGPFVELDRSAGPGLPDGLRVDSSGRLFVTGPGGVWILAPDGHVLGLLRTPEVPANCEFMTREGERFLAITARTSVYWIALRS